MSYQKLKEFSEDNGFTSRKERYQILERYFGVSAETCRKIVSAERDLRDVFPITEKGIELEKTYHKSEQIHNFEYETGQLFKLRPLT